MQRTIAFKDRDELSQILGVYDRNVRLIRSRTGAKVFVRNGEVRIQGGRAAVEKAFEVLTKVREVVVARGDISEQEVLELLEGRWTREVVATTLGPSRVFRRGVDVAARTPGQAAYLKLMDQNPVTIAIGPAGTGKTFLAVARAVDALRAGTVRRLILVRPVVEAGERLGFLPGDIEAKVNPYLQPVYDALNRFLELGQLQRLVDNDIIEIAPLAYMRGRTLDDAFIVLDEGQNTTYEQMKMFLTRLGENSKMVATGDITQIDLSPHKPSGLVLAVKLLRGIVGIGISELGREDIVRHPLVQKIVEVYERHERRR